MLKIHKRIYIIVLALVVILIGGVAYQRAATIQFNLEKGSENLKEASYEPLLLVVLESKMAELSNLMLEADIVNYVTQANEQYDKLEAEKLLDIDAYWETTPDDNPLLKFFTTNKAARRIKEFQSSRSAFIEIFITDKHGFNLAQTSRTSDIYQADEEWWEKAYRGGKGRSFIGAIQFDADFLTAGIPIHVPIVNPSSNEIIGVAKGIVSIEAIKSEL